MEPALRYHLYLQWYSLGENGFFLCESLSIGGSWIRDGSLCPFALSALGPYRAYSWADSACCHSLCEFSYALLLLCLEGLLSLVPFTDPGSNNLPLLPKSSLSSEGRALTETAYLWSRLELLYNCGHSSSFPSTEGENFSNDGRASHWSMSIAEYS